jgi:hypothetical protein
MKIKVTSEEKRYNKISENFLKKHQKNKKLKTPQKRDKQKEKFRKKTK